jgi:putative GTP pyrophosphokinase
MVLAAEKFPGGSRERVSQAGDAVREKRATADDYATIERWRAAHRSVLNSFQAILRTRTRDQDIVVAQRHKRRNTIFGKLHRFPKMRLHRMDDVAGCRLIFQTIEELYKFRESLHKARFKHELRNDPDKYDYIKKPKSDGYRGIHDVYKYDVNSPHGVNIKGLQIELQYRTVYQHAWATCVEIVGLVTKSNPKFKYGDQRYEQIMACASEMIARTFEGVRGSLAQLSNAELIAQFYEHDNALSFMEMLSALEKSNIGVKGKQNNVILIFSPDEQLQMLTFKDEAEAIHTLFKLEDEHRDTQKDIVLVRGSRKSVQNAFRNYFTDATDFLNYIRTAMITLEPSREDFWVRSPLSAVLENKTEMSWAEKLRIGVGDYAAKHGN